MAEDRQMDKIRVAGGQEYEVDYFAEKHGISKEQAQKLIDEHGNMRDVLDREAEKLKQRQG